MSTAQKYNVTLKDPKNGTAEQMAEAKKHAESQGGTITHEFKLIKGFTVEFPADTVHTFATNDKIIVEPDSEVKTQSKSQ